MKNLSFSAPTLAGMSCCLITLLAVRRGYASKGRETMLTPRFFLMLLFCILIPQATTQYKIETRYPVPGNGGFDYITLDQATRRLYVSHGTQVDVVDADSGKLVGTIGDTPGVHGVVI